MAIANYICQACGDDLAILEESPDGPQLILAEGLAPRADGSAVCPACGAETVVIVPPTTTG